ncbi:hypothetical protein PYL11_12060 [Staphylococcus epidermidis]|nr:hypothetical protein [Staphylococcus epidermidis]
MIWIPITYLYQVIFYDTTNIKNTSEILQYYGIHKGYFGMDHGVKAIAYVGLSFFPILIMNKIISQKALFKHWIATFFGTVSFIIIGLSLMIQAFTAEKLVELYNNETSNKDIYLKFFDFFITDGVLSYSMYIISYLIYCIWIILIYKNLKNYNKFSSILLSISAIMSILSVLTIFVNHLLEFNIIDISSITDFLNLIIILSVTINFSKKN